MHDSQIEEQLRGVLRAEGDGIPLTITTAELERRLAARRRSTGGRRLSWIAAAVAAIAVVSIVAAGNGWLKLPAIGTVPSPSPSASALTTPERSPVPSFKPVPGVGRIQPPEGSTVLTEILPTAIAGVDIRRFDADLPLDQYVVNVAVGCVGTGLQLTEGSHTWPIACDPTPAVEPMVAIIDVPVADGHLALQWSADRNVGYTILVTKSPMPANLPALPSLDATIVPVIDAASPSDRPLPGAVGTLVTQSVGTLPDAPDYEIDLVCLGPGEMPYSLGQPGRTDFVMSSKITCDGQPKRESYSNGGGAIGPHEVYLTTDSRTAWHARIGVVGAVPSTSPASAPPAARSALGRPDQAILVRPIGASWTTPDSLEVTLFDPADQTSTVIATIPGTVIPTGMWISTTTTPVVSSTGWLAIPIRPGPDATDPEPGVVFVDLQHSTTTPNSVVGISSGSWNGDDTFAGVSEGGVQIYDPATGYIGMAPITDPAVHAATLGGPAADPIWTTAANSRFVGLRDSGATPSGPQGWGVISVDGTFSPTTDLPPTYQRTGLERPTGADAHQFTLACEGGGTIAEAGCSLVEIDPSGARIATRVSPTDYPYLADSAWAADGRDAWLLFGTAPDGGRGEDGVASLSLSRPDGTRQEYSRLRLGRGNLAILGVSQSPDGLPIVAIGSRSSWLRGFVAARGGPLNAGSPGYGIGTDETTWFAGWAGQQPDYDPD